jgi:hypothetical protein
MRDAPLFGASTSWLLVHWLLRDASPFGASACLT